MDSACQPTVGRIIAPFCRFFFINLMFCASVGSGLSRRLFLVLQQSMWGVLHRWTTVWKSLRLAILGAVVTLTAPNYAVADIIDFEDLNTRKNFVDQGIADDYKDFQWGHSTSAGLAGAQIPSTESKGWASATTGSPASGSPPNNVQGNVYAWNWDSVQSLFIKFGALYDVESAYLAKLSATEGATNQAESVQLFGYAENGTQIGSSSVFTLTNTLTQHTISLNNIFILEIRASAPSKFFSVDNIALSKSSVTAVPEPSSIAIIGAVMLVVGSLGRNRRRIDHRR
ncbi:MAG: PEP-CTERM sorting domain-containing protein [Planctomycetota bacterium]|nr:MAG: PEP-CTERM sorting domain-containing protein [Planctomycetota bacterium]